MLFSEQIAKIGGMDLSMHWVETVQKAGTDEDRKAIGAWLTGGRGPMEKSFVEMHARIQEFLKLPEEDRTSMAPDAMAVAMKADKAINVVQTTLKNFFTQTKWPAGSHAKDKVKQGTDALEKNMMVIKQSLVSGQERTLNMEGQTLKPAQRPADAQVGMEIVIAERALLYFHHAREEAIAHKKAYTDAKLKAKALFADYQAAVKKASPQIALKNFDWNAPDVLETIESDPIIKAALQKQGMI